jgi:hypothetical protein
MLNKSKYFRKLCISACLILGLTFLATSAKAQFIGINVDYAIDYSAAPGKVDGYSVGISHPAPFFPNIGFSSISFSEKEDKTDASDNTSVSLNTNTTIKTIILFYNVPFPVVTISVGFGYGSQNLYTGMETITTIVETYYDKGAKIVTDKSELKTSVSEVFLQIGLPFWNTIEFHLGYHHMSVTSIDITSKKSKNFRGKYTIEKKNYSGGMTTIGVQVAF